MSTPKHVEAHPNKAFFVHMLTRDIDLSDAILDLLDNCVDGITRQLAPSSAEPSTIDQPYDGYWAKIVATPERFEIWDNCGGIPEEIARNSAFMMGRPNTDRDDDIETVGMYGIGMKRAIFKLGRSCVVTSQPATGQYHVDISTDWMNDDADWTLKLEESEKSEQFKENGTKIIVEQLLPGIQRQFKKSKSSFLASLEKEVSQHYALILQKGFSVQINGSKIKPVKLSVLSPSELGIGDESKIEPYIFRGKFADVSVELAVGFYRSLAKENEIEDSLLKSTRDHAGWTVVCNERVVLYNDKSAITGWGTHGVPSFHNQFISIAGVVSFRSKQSMQLPLNTTKRGLDTSSEIYHIVLHYMQEGMKKFISFTNVWKRSEEEMEAAFEELSPQDPARILSELDASKLRRIRNHKDKGTGSFYSPNLPKPKNEKRKPRICFNATDAEISLVQEYFFADQHVDRSALGRKCFDESLVLAREVAE